MMFLPFNAELPLKLLEVCEKRHILFIRCCIIYAKYHFNCWDFFPCVISAQFPRNISIYFHFHLVGKSATIFFFSSVCFVIIFRIKESGKSTLEGKCWRRRQGSKREQQHMESMHHHGFLKLFFRFCDKVKNGKIFHALEWSLFKNS